MKQRMTLLLITGLLLCMAAFQASAQRQMPSAEDRAKALTDSLSLSKEQAAKVLAIYKDADAQRQEVFNANSGDRDAARQAMRGIMQKTDARIDSLLTEKQKTKYDEMKAARMQRWQNRQQQPPAEKPKDESK